MKASNSRGFTLVELLVVIAVSGILLTIVAGSYTNFFFSSILNGEVDSLVSMLRLAKSKSMAEVDDKAYQVVVSADSFRLETEGGVNLLETHRLNSQSLVTSAPITVVFRKISGDSPSCAAGCTVTIGNNPSTGMTRSVVVSNQGVITVP